MTNRGQSIDNNLLRFHEKISAQLAALWQKTYAQIWVCVPNLTKYQYFEINQNYSIGTTKMDKVTVAKG